MKIEEKFDVLLTEQDYKNLAKDGLTEEEIEILKDASAIAETLNILPDDVGEVFNKYEQMPTKTYGETIEGLIAIAQRDPKFFAQLMAITDLVASDNQADVEIKPDPALANFSDEELDQAMKRMYSTLQSLTPEKHAEFMALLQKITPAQKVALVKDLLR